MVSHLEPLGSRTNIRSGTPGPSSSMPADFITTPEPADRHQWRRLMRSRRQALTPAEQQAASQALAERLLASPLLQQAQCIGLYLANDGELDPAALVAPLWQQGKQLCLPRLHPFASGQLLFLRYQPQSILLTNRFGIPEPQLDVRAVVPLAQIDLLLCPLVAFDLAGNRLGMGGGFYDRTLSRWQGQPQLLGLAHDCQQVTALPNALWDVPLPQIATPSQLYDFNAS